MSKRPVKKNVPKVEKKLIIKEDEQEYGLVTKTLGNGRFSIRLNLQNKEVIGRLRGKFRKGSQKKKNWVDVGTVVLVSVRDFEDNNVDIIHVYDDAETRILKKNGDIVFDSNREEVEDTTEDDVFVFEDI